MKVQIFNYNIIETFPLEKLEEFKDHRRLKVFYNKGCRCVVCGRAGTQLIKCEKRGQIHYDVYDDEFYPLTVDHIIPISKGGSDDLENLQPMCHGCNSLKGNGDFIKENMSRYRPSRYKKITKNVLIGTEVFVRCGSRKTKIRKIGNFEEFAINPYTNKESVKIGNSYFNMDSVYLTV